MKPISDRLGLSWHGQRERLRRDAVLSEGGRMMRLPSAGGMQETLVLRADLAGQVALGQHVVVCGDAGAGAQGQQQGARHQEPPDDPGDQPDPPDEEPPGT